MTLEPIRILFTIPNFITAGSGLALLHVARRLDRALFEPAICVLRTGGQLEETICDLGIPLLELPFTVPPRPRVTLPFRLWQAAQRFRPYQFDLWHSYHYSDDYTEPLIARLSGARAWIYTKKNMGWGSRAWRLRSRLASRIAAQNTTMIDKFFSSTQFDHKASLLPPGVDVTFYRPGVKPALQIRQSLGLEKTDFLIGCNAHLVPVKGHPTLIKAVARIPGAHLVLAGKPLDAVYAGSLHALCDELDISDRVHFLDHVDNIPALNAELDVFVLPTLARFRMEGCPIALLEAMACGLACVASDIPGPNDVLKSGENGVLVPSEDVDALISTLTTLAENEAARRRLGGQARSHILANYTIEREVEQYQMLYMDALQSSQVIQPALRNS